MATQEEERLPDRLNAEPAVFKGCSSSELAAFAGLAAAIWLPVSIVLSWLAGALTMGFGIAGAGMVGTVVALATVFQKLKRNRPDGYYQLRFRIWLADKRLLRSSLILRSQWWSLGRTRAS